MISTTTNRSVSRLSSVTAAVLALALVCQGGCGGPDEEPPKTYEVTGTVLGADGKPLSGGLVEFRSGGDKPVSATGRIQPDGSFSLSTIAGEQKLPGAVAGTHKVTVIPPPPETGDIQAVPQPVVLPGTYEVKPGGDNKFTVKLGR